MLYITSSNFTYLCTIYIFFVNHDIIVYVIVYSEYFASSRTGHWQIEHGRPLICWSKRGWTWFRPRCGHPTVLTSIQLIMWWWLILRDHVYGNQINNVEELHQHIEEEWDSPDQRMIDSAIREWCERLRVCVAADRGHFEHTLWTWLFCFVL